MKKPSLKSSMPPPIDEVTEAMKKFEALEKPQPEPAESDVPVAETTATKKKKGVMTTIHLPRPLLAKLRQAAIARSDRRAETEGGLGGRPSVSAVIVELLEKHLDELTD